MPYSVTFEDPYIRMEVRGTLTAAILSDMATELSQLESTYDQIPDHLTDLSAVEGSEGLFESVFGIALRRRRANFPSPFRSAIFAPHEPAAGYARMFQTLNTNPQIHIQVFDSMPEAEAWLKSR